MKLTLAITTYNRFELLIDSFAEIIHDPRITEVLIVDDCSTSAIWAKVKNLENFHPKIRVIRQAINRGMALNKAHAVSYARTEWVILFDSDNIIKPEYLDALQALAEQQGGMKPDHIYMPDFAWPNFDYRHYDNQVITKINAPQLIEDDRINMALNTCNYVVHRDKYTEVFKTDPTIKATDTIYFAYLWLQANYFFYVVPGMSYFHRVHDQSGFMQEASYNMKKGQEIKNLIQKL